MPGQISVGDLGQNYSGGNSFMGVRTTWRLGDEAPIYDRARLGTGDHIDGPAIITLLDATTLLLLGQSAEIDPLGSLFVHDPSPFRTVQDES